MILPCTKVVHISEEKGLGVIATAPIPKGTITWVSDELDREYTPAQLRQMHPVCREAVLNYSYRNNIGNFVFCWDNEKYINHSFHPNCCHTPYNLEIAVRDIAAGEELTDDYGFLNIIEPFTVKSEGTGRNTVYPDDLRRYSDTWDQLIREAFDNFLRVAQPLQSLFSPERWETLNSIARRTEPIISIRSCLYSGG